MTALADATDPRFTPTQSAHLARPEAAVAPPEVTEAARIEEVARAVWAADGFPGPTWEDEAEGNRADYRRLAAAAVAAYRATQDGEAEEAVRRVDPPGCGCTDCCTGVSVPEIER